MTINKCPYCGDTDTKLIGRITSEMGRFELWQCNKCNMTFVVIQENR